MDLEAHLNTAKHISNVRGASSVKINTLFAKQESHISASVSAAEGAIAFHTVKHHQSFKSMDCTSKLQKELFKDSNVAKQISCARTKTEAIINSVLSPYAIDVTVELIGGISCFGVATDGSNHGSVKIFPILVQYFDVKSGGRGIQTKVVELKSTPNERAETIASYIADTLKCRGIHDKCVAYAGDNTNTNFGGIGRGTGNNVFTHLKTKLNKSLVGVGCPAHVLHNCVQHGVDVGLAVDVDAIIQKIFNYFSIYTVRTESLKEFCEFAEIQYRQLLGHSKTRWLSLFPCVTRLIEMYPALKSYFLSQEQIPKCLKTFFEDELSEARLWFVHSLMSVFHHNIQALEREQSSLVEIMSILENTFNVIKERNNSNFKSLKVKEILRNKREQGYAAECEEFNTEISLVYESTMQYLQKWMVQYKDFSVFKWMKLDGIPTWEEVEQTLIFLNETTTVKIDDVKCFDQFANFREFCKTIISGGKENITNTNDIWCRYFNANTLALHSELLKIAEYFFAIPSHNGCVERLFSLMNSQWTKERNRLSVESVKGILTVQYNFKHLTCSQFYNCLLGNKALLEQIRSSKKYERNPVSETELCDDSD